VRSKTIVGSGRGHEGRMNAEYRNPLTANILTGLGWLHGTFHLPPHQSLVDFLAPGVRVIKFTRVQLPPTTEVIPFVALRCEAVTLVEPTLGDDPVETAAGGADGDMAALRGALYPSGPCRELRRRVRRHLGDRPHQPLAVGPRA
jgi:hypothetical protein